MLTERFPAPDRTALIAAYRQLYDRHPHHLLCLETRLPSELQYKARDQYRILMTMILSQRTSDHNLSKSLGKLFHDYPNIDVFKKIDSLSQARSMLKGYGFQVDGPAQYNAKRFWHFTQLYFGKWSQTITTVKVSTLSDIRGYGYGPKTMKALEAYICGNRNVLPLDGRAFEALRNGGLYQYGSNIDEVRADIENKVSGYKSVSLIDFHEMLRFIEQTSRDERIYRDVIIGWNAWRLLCSSKRHEVAKDWSWVREYLVKDDTLAKELWDFFRQISNG